MLSPKTRAPTRPGTAKRRNAKPNAVNRLGICYSKARLVDPWQSSKINGLSRRSAPNPCADQHPASQTATPTVHPFNPGRRPRIGRSGGAAPGGPETGDPRPGRHPGDSAPVGLEPAIAAPSSPTGGAPPGCRKTWHSTPGPWSRRSTPTRSSTSSCLDDLFDFRSFDILFDPGRSMADLLGLVQRRICSAVRKAYRGYVGRPSTRPLTPRTRRAFPASTLQPPILIGPERD